MLLCLTANHRNASFDLLEKLSIGAPGAAQALVAANPEVRGAVVLATCNRFEAYLEIDPTSAGTATDAAIAAMSVASDIEAESLRDAVTIIGGDGVVRHLFAVSSGLESVVVGEDEISGQVRRALDQARAAGTTSSELERLFQKATHTSRGVKTKTGLGGAGRSLVRLSLELASSRVADWAEARILLVGTGQYAATTVAALSERGASSISVYSPSGRAQAFAARYSLHQALSLPGAIGASDIIITCTSDTVIGPESFPSSCRHLVIDLGLPRNVDPAVGALEGVELLDLETIRVHAPLDELTATDDARTLVGTAAAQYAADRSAEPGIVALRKHIFEVLDGEIERARARGDSSGQTESALRHLAGVLLHTPSTRARELAREGEAAAFVAGLGAVYGIRVETLDEQGEESATA